MKRIFFVIPVAVFLALAGLLYAGLQDGPPTYVPSGMVGKPAPEIALPAMDAQAQSFDRAELAQGQPTIVNFWASWCTPCREEHATLEALAAQKGIRLYGVAYKDDPEKSRAFLTELGNPFAKIDADHDGRTAIDWGVTGVPETFVVDGSGVIRVHYAGPLTEDVIAKEIMPALKSGGDPAKFTAR
jgi:cytochrome c biogenesis protein CcmG, thiol:disulfide interchange protein DsbE